jgi:Asp/Glu/hydantoin racemase
VLQLRVVRSARTVADRDLAEVVIMTGSVMAGLEQDVTRAVGIPALSGMVCGIKLAETLVDLGRAHVAVEYIPHVPQARPPDGLP